MKVILRQASHSHFYARSPGLGTELRPQTRSRVCLSMVCAPAQFQEHGVSSERCCPWSPYFDLHTPRGLGAESHSASCPAQIKTKMTCVHVTGWSWPLQVGIWTILSLFEGREQSHPRLEMMVKAYLHVPTLIFIHWQSYFSERETQTSESAWLYARR